jgi:hypothetical protein
VRNSASFDGSAALFVRAFSVFYDLASGRPLCGDASWWRWRREDGDTFPDSLAFVFVQTFANPIVNDDSWWWWRRRWFGAGGMVVMAADLVHFATIVHANLSEPTAVTRWTLGGSLLALDEVGNLGSLGAANYFPGARELGIMAFLSETSFNIATTVLIETPSSSQGLAFGESGDNRLWRGRSRA